MVICMYLGVYCHLHSHSLAEKYLAQNTPQASASYPEYRGVWLCVGGVCEERHSPIFWHHLFNEAVLSQNRLVWNRPPRSASPTVNPAVPSPALTMPTNTLHSTLAQACCKGPREQSRSRGQRWTWHGSPVSFPARAQHGAPDRPGAGTAAASRRPTETPGAAGAQPGRLREGPPPRTRLPSMRSLLGRAAKGSGHRGSPFCRPGSRRPALRVWLTTDSERGKPCEERASERPPTLVPSLRPSSSFAAASMRTAAAPGARSGCPWRTRQGGSACSSCPRKPPPLPRHLERCGRHGGRGGPTPRPRPRGAVPPLGTAGPAPAPCPRPLGGAVPGGAVPRLASAAPALRGGEGAGVFALPRRERQRRGRRRLLTGTKRGQRGRTVRAGEGRGRGGARAPPGPRRSPRGGAARRRGRGPDPSLPLPSAAGRGDSAVAPARPRLPGSRPRSPRVPAGTLARRRGVRPPAGRCSLGEQGSIKQGIGEAVRARSPGAGRWETSSRGAGGVAPAGGCGGWGVALNFARSRALPRSASLSLSAEHPGVTSRRMFFFFLGGLFSGVWFLFPSLSQHVAT